MVRLSEWSGAKDFVESLNDLIDLFRSCFAKLVAKAIYGESSNLTYFHP